MAGVNDGSMQQWLLIKNCRKHPRHRARSRRKLQGIRQVMQSTLLGQFQQQVRFPISGNPGRNQRFLFSLLRSMRVGPVSNTRLNSAISRLKIFNPGQVFFGYFFCSHQPIDPGSTRDVGQTSCSVNTTLIFWQSFDLWPTHQST